MATRRLLDADVTFISLCGKGANKKTLIYKSQNSQAPTLQKTVQIKKVDSDQHKVYCIVYSPDETDTQGDTADVTAIEKMAYRFMKSGRNNNVDQDHDYIADEGFIAESWILKTSDPIFPLEKEGSWAVCIKVENEETWQKVKDGEITGLSMAAIAQVEEIPDETTDATLNKSIKQNTTGVVMKTFAEIKKFITDLFKTNTDNVQKDLNSEVQSREVNSLVYALERVVYSIYENDDIEDKKLAVLESIDQLKNQVALVKSEQVEKAGKTLSAKTLEVLKAIKDCHGTMGGHLDALMSAAAEGKEEPVEKGAKEDSNSVNNNPKSEDQMKPEEIQKAITDGIAAAITPLNEQIEKQNTTIAELQKSLNDRVEKIEKSTPGSQQQVGDNGGNGGSGDRIFI